MHWRDLAKHVRRTVGQVDALIVDAPYSERCQVGFDSEMGQPSDLGIERRALDYSAWSASDVDAFVEEWSPLVSGWFVSITDHVLGAAWESAFGRVGRYAFSPIACLEPGSRCRLLGDGPSQWSTFAYVARPKTSEFLERRKSSRRARGAPMSLPGGYVVPCERSRGVVGGKALVLMERLVDDYSEPGDLVCDPCMGAGTTLLAAKLLGRQYIGGDLDESHVEIARERLRDLPAQPKKGTLALPWEKP